MRIAIVGPRGVPATYSGPETAAAELSRRLVARGHEVTVFCRRHHYRGGPDLEVWEGVHRRMVGGVATKHLDTITHSLVAAIRMGRASYDVALVSIVGNLPVAALLRAKGIPVVFNVDGTDSDREKWGRLARAYLRLAESLASRAADVLVTDAEFLRERFGSAARVIPYGSERPVRLPGLELARFGLAQGDYLLHVGRLEPENGALDVVRAHASLDHRPPLVVVGDAPYAASYRERVHSAASPEVVFAGFCYGEAYEELMSNAAAIVLATRVGGTHPVVVEAMGYRLPVIAPDVTVMREMLGDAGIYYGDLAALMHKAWTDREWAKKKGEEAWSRAHELYSWEAVTDAYEEAFAEAIAGRVSRARARSGT